MRTLRNLILTATIAAAALLAPRAHAQTFAVRASAPYIVNYQDSDGRGQMVVYVQGPVSNPIPGYELSITLRQNGNVWTGAGVLYNGGYGIYFELAGYTFNGSFNGAGYSGRMYDALGQYVDDWVIF